MPETPLGNKREKEINGRTSSGPQRYSFHRVPMGVVQRGKTQASAGDDGMPDFSPGGIPGTICRHATRITPNHRATGKGGDQVRDRHSHSSYFAIALQAMAYSEGAAEHRRQRGGPAHPAMGALAARLLQ